MRACFLVIGVILLGMQPLSAQGLLRPAYITCSPVPAGDATCVSDEQDRLVLPCGEVVFLLVEGETSVRFGRTARRAPPRILAVVRSWTGHYVIFASEELFQLITPILEGHTRRR